MREPAKVALQTLGGRDPATGVWIASTRAASVLGDHLAGLSRATLPELAARDDVPGSIVVAGSGRLIDGVKRVRGERFPAVELIAIATLWGSGAEASPVVVADTDMGKQIEIGERFLPSARVVVPEFASTIGPGRAQAACGDVWAHALEAFLSPLASEELRRSLASLLRRLLETPVGPDPAWFDLGARACWLQSQASVGLVHGLAHQIEYRLGDPGVGHARLCGTMLLPVMRFNVERSSTLGDLCAVHELDAAAISRTLGGLFDAELYIRCKPLIRERWRHILLDPCSRTNCALVRPADAGFFESFAP